MEAVKTIKAIALEAFRAVKNVQSLDLPLISSLAASAPEGKTRYLERQIFLELEKLKGNPFGEKWLISNKPKGEQSFNLALTVYNLMAKHSFDTDTINIHLGEFFRGVFWIDELEQLCRVDSYGLLFRDRATGIKITEFLLRHCENGLFKGIPELYRDNGQMYKNTVQIRAIYEVLGEMGVLKPELELKGHIDTARRIFVEKFGFTFIDRSDTNTAEKDVIHAKAWNPFRSINAESDDFFKKNIKRILVNAISS